MHWSYIFFALTHRNVPQSWHAMAYLQGPVPPSLHLQYISWFPVAPFANMD